MHIGLMKNLILMLFYSIEMKFWIVKLVGEVEVKVGDCGRLSYKRVTR